MSSLKDHDKRAALADQYGWKIGGWAVDLDNPAGISLFPKWVSDDPNQHLRFKHSDSLKQWESVLKKNKLTKPKNFKPPAAAKTFDDVVAENTALRAELKRLKKRR
jgi:hypothetical protein